MSGARPSKALHIVFNLCSTALAIGTTFFVYNHSQSHHVIDNPSALLFVAACVYFVANTLPVAIIITLTEGRRCERYGRIATSGVFLTIWSARALSG